MRSWERAQKRISTDTYAGPLSGRAWVLGGEILG